MAIIASPQIFEIAVLRYASTSGEKRANLIA
jgi:hypothetical protein